MKSIAADNSTTPVIGLAIFGAIAASMVGSIFSSLTDSFEARPGRVRGGQEFCLSLSGFPRERVTHLQWLE
jgi:hypothetical protein